MKINGYIVQPEKSDALNGKVLVVVMGDFSVILSNSRSERLAVEVAYKNDWIEKIVVEKK